MKDIDINIKDGVNVLGTLSLKEKKRLVFKNMAKNKTLTIYEGMGSPPGIGGIIISDYIIFPGNDYAPLEGQYLVQPSYNNTTFGSGYIWSLVSSFSIFDTSLRFFIEPYEE